MHRVPFGRRRIIAARPTSSARFFFAANKLPVRRRCSPVGRPGGPPAAPTLSLAGAAEGNTKSHFGLRAKKKKRLFVRVILIVRMAHTREEEQRRNSQHTPK